VAGSTPNDSADAANHITPGETAGKENLLSEIPSAKNRGVPLA